MGVDLKRTYFERVDSLPLATAATVTDEGQALVSVLEGGVEKVKPSTGAAAEKFAGFAVFRQRDYTTAPVVEEVTIPSAGPYTVELAHQNLIAGQIRVHDVLANTDFTVGAGAGQYTVNNATGTLTFNIADAGRAMVVYYRYNLTVAESRALYYDIPTNYPDANLFGSVGVGKGLGRVYLTVYDQSVDWGAVDGSGNSTVVVKCMAGGLLTNGGAGAAVPNARVIKAPGTGIGNATLGIEFGD